MSLTPADLTVGQKVWLRDTNRRQVVASRGTITKIGRKLVTIQSDEIGWWTKQYRLDSQQVNDDYGHQSFVTDDQAAAEVKRREDLETLNQHGFLLEWRAKPDGALLSAVAEFIRGWETQ